MNDERPILCGRCDCELIMGSGLHAPNETGWLHKRTGLADCGPDPRYLGGETMVLTDTRQMALVIALGHDGACDITVNIANADAITALESVIAHIKTRPDNFTPHPPALQEDTQP